MNNQRRALLSLVLATLFSLATSFSWILISGYCGFEFGFLSALLIAGSFALACRISGKVVASRMKAISVTIVLVWIIAWIVFCPVIVSADYRDRYWAAYPLINFRADITAISIGLFLLMYLPPHRQTSRKADENR